MRWIKASEEKSQHYVNKCCRLIGEEFWFTAYLDWSKKVYVPRNFSGIGQYIEINQIEYLDESPDLQKENREMAAKKYTNSLYWQTPKDGESESDIEVKYSLGQAKSLAENSFKSGWDEALSNSQTNKEEEK